METGARSGGDEEESRRESPEAPEAEAPGGRKQIYLRTVYALNPGIPHYVDVPGLWN